MRVIQEITNEKISRRIDAFEARMRREREEKTMLNFDKYREAITSGDPEELPCHIAAVRRHTEPCDGNHCLDCMRENHKWLLDKYEPPLLKNGDGLKPGDWIMVRDCEAQSFVKRQFLYFYGHRFYCAHMGLTPLEDQIEWYKQARLPEEGE